MHTSPNYAEEQQLWKRGFSHVAGVDEVGRGCFAGPVVAAAVILPTSFPYSHLVNDSKVVPPSLRERLSCIIKLYARAYSIVEIPVEVINTLGVGKAAQEAFSQAINALPKKPDYILIDAFLIKKVRPTMQKPIIHGDGLSISIAAASIIAKVYRDNRMQTLHEQHPHYNFKQNKGYGTEEHQDAIKRHGLSPLHRTSFNLTPFI